jgi:hypothetical protein
MVVRSLVSHLLLILQVLWVGFVLSLFGCQKLQLTCTTWSCMSLHDYMLLFCTVCTVGSRWCWCKNDLKPLKQDLFRSLSAYQVLCLSSVEDMKESQNMHLVQGNWVSKETGFCILNFLQIYYWQKLHHQSFTRQENFVYNLTKSHAIK